MTHQDHPPAGAGAFTPDPRAAEFLGRLARVCSGIVMAIAGVVLLGWILGEPALIHLGRVRNAMAPNASIGLFAAGVALWLLLRPTAARMRAARALALIPLVLGGLTLVEYVGGIDLGLDQAFLADKLGLVHTGFPGRMAPLAALVLALAGISLLFIDVGFGRRRDPALWLTVPQFVLVVLALFGWGYRAENLMAASGSTGIALYTGVTMLALIIGIACARPGRGPATIFSAAGDGGILARRLLPVAVVLPAALGWLLLQGIEHGVYGGEGLAALTATITFLVLAGMSWGLARTLEQRYQEREAAGQGLQVAHARLRRFVDANVVGVVVAGADGSIAEANDYYLNLIGYSRDELRQGKIDWRAITPPEWSAADERGIREMRERGTCTPYEKQYVRPDGSRVWVHLVYAVLPGPPEQIAAFVLDITGRKRAEETLQHEMVERESAERALQQREQELRLIINTTPALISYIDADYRYRRVNRSYELWFGHSAAEIQGHEVRQVLGELAWDAVRPFMERALAGENVTYERELPYKDGGTRWVYVTYTPHRVDGRVVGFVVHVMDIGERKRAEQVIQAASQYARSLIEASLDPLVTISPEGKVTDVNKATEQAVGLPREALIGTDFASYFTEPEAASAGYRQVIRDGSVRDYPLVLRHVSGRTMDVLYNATTYRDAVGTTQGVFAAARDITQRKLAEDRLARANRALHMIYAVNEEVLHAQTAEGLMQRACDLAVDLGGYRMAWIGAAEHTPERTVRPVAHAGKNGNYLGSVDITWADEPRGRGPTGRAIREGAPQAARFILTDPTMAPWREPALRHGYASSVALPLRLGAEMFGALMMYSEHPDAFDDDELRMLREMTTDLGFGLNAIELQAGRLEAEHKIRALNANLERRVRERTAELEAANEELESFAYSVSHDLRAPLRTIDGFSKIVEEDYADRVDAEGRDSLHRVRAAAQKMAQLIDDILKLSRLSRAEMTRDAVNLSALASEIARELTAADPARSVTFAIAPELTARGDSKLLKVVLDNLLGNAWKFTSKHPSARIEVGITVKDGQPACYVRDDGAGFDMAHVGNLFAPFQRLHNATEFPGTGIGLATVRRVVQRHGGRIWAEGAVGKGATFYFTLGSDGLRAPQTPPRHVAAAA